MDNFLKSHLVTIIFLSIYYFIIAVILLTHYQNSDPFCGTSDAYAIVLWSIGSIIICIILTFRFLVEKEYSWKKYSITLGLICTPVLIIIKWFFY